ncbi:uncharacterized protein qrfp [Pangasianodon hypophthalmus]|uniref:uncharacterized protein qrfp n=1 Tax=Pangasianodon hypophthalmus TaxID=310915 RepID=UPI00147CFC15|nr:uncharacterized protein qrfp [Pangasianodon hypophthalmus]
MKFQPSHICSSLLMSLLLLCPEGGLTFPLHPIIPDYKAALIEAWMEPMEKMEMMEMGRRALGPLVKHPMETVYYKRGEEEEDMEEGGIQRNEVLSSIAGGLQAFNRQKGGFGFRFGRK